MTTTQNILEALDEIENPTREELKRIADRFSKPLRYIQAILYQNKRFPQAKLLHNPKVQTILKCFHTEEILKTAEIRSRVMRTESEEDRPEEGLLSAPSEVNLYLRRLIEAGILVRIKRGYYRVTELYRNEVFRSWDRSIIERYPTPYISNDDMLITTYGLDDAVFSQRRHDDYTKTVLRMIQLKNSIQKLVEKMVQLNVTVVESQMHDTYLTELKSLEDGAVHEFLNNNVEFIVFNLARLSYDPEDPTQLRTRLRDLFEGWLAVYPAPDHMTPPRSEFVALYGNEQREVVDFMVKMLRERPIDDPGVITVVCHSKNTVGRELTHFEVQK